MSSQNVLQTWFSQNFKIVQDDYFHFLRFKSISTDAAFKKEMQSCALWLKDYIAQKTGMKSELIETKGAPLVYAENLTAGSNAPTLLIYGHYDVQPADPIDLWENDPFEPTLRNGNIYARGAADNKGQIFYSLMAIRSFHELGIKLPVNVKFCIEGEEESGSHGLSLSLPDLKEKLKGDALLVVDFDGFDKETPGISLGARGIVALELTLTGSPTDLHSGVHGGMAYNPNRAMVQLLSKLWDDKGRIQVKGFYDDVVVMNEEERGQFSFAFDEKSYSKTFDIDAIGGENDFSLAEKNTVRPTLEINGLSGGYAGMGFKTVIPAHTIAKLSCRLVPHQDPEKIIKNLTAFLNENVVDGMKVQVVSFGGEKAFRSSTSSKLATAVAKAATEVTGKNCKKMLCGGSIPIISSMMEILSMDVVGMGYGLPTDDIHAPNEHFDMNRFEKGFLTVARTLELL